VSEFRFSGKIAKEETAHQLRHVYGTARITEGGAAGLLRELAHAYLGPGARFPPMDDPPPGYITHIKVDRVSGVGPWAARS
jgi:hypothetical protein